MKTKEKTVVVIQARMGSERFPGKMLAQLGPYNILEWVLKRVTKARAVDDFILATSDKDKEEEIVQLAVSNKVPVFRGSEENVLDRMIGAAEVASAKNVVRVCADNPLVAAEEIDRLVQHFARVDCDYACNHQDRMGSGYADGFGAEIVSLSVLKDLLKKKLQQRHREHVTLFLWENIEKYSMQALKAPDFLAYPSLRFDVDTPDDLYRLRAIVDNGVTINSPAKEIVEVTHKLQRHL